MVSPLAAAGWGAIALAAVETAPAGPAAGLAIRQRALAERATPARPGRLSTSVRRAATRLMPDLAAMAAAAMAGQGVPMGVVAAAAGEGLTPWARAEAVAWARAAATSPTATLPTTAATVASAVAAAGTPVGMVLPATVASAAVAVRRCKAAATVALVAAAARPAWVARAPAGLGPRAPLRPAAPARTAPLAAASARAGRCS